jgi:hypothetical protein
MSARQFPQLPPLPASMGTVIAPRKPASGNTRSPEGAPDLASNVGNLALIRLITGTSLSKREEAHQQEQEADAAADRIVAGRTSDLVLPGTLSNVHIYTSGPAAEAAQALHLQAFTMSNHVVFAPGRFDPGTRAGKRLLAHELAHVGQQHTSGPRVQAKPDEGIPPYLWSIESRLRPQADKQIKMWAEEIGPLATLTSKFPELPLREGVPIDIPYINLEHPPEFTLVEDPSAEGGFRAVGPPHGEFLLHSQLAGGYELVAYDPMKGKVLIGRYGIGYVLNDEMFAALFGKDGLISGMFEEFEALPKLLHDKPWLPLVLHLSGYLIMIGMMMTNPELMAAFESVGPLTGELLEAETFARGLSGIFEETALSGADTAALGRIFEELGGTEMGYTVQICNESTVVETATSRQNVGLMAKNQGGRSRTPRQKQSGSTSRWWRGAVLRVNGTSS